MSARRQGVPKYFRTRLPDAILAVTGEKFAKKFSSHGLRRTVATRLAESLGDAGDKLVKRVLGQSDGSVTAIYNRYGYAKEDAQGARAVGERPDEGVCAGAAVGYSRAAECSPIRIFVSH